jgi:flavin-binding protein dodecin
MASVTEYTGGEVFPTGSFPWRALEQIFLLGCLRRSYSPKCLEEEFSEVRTKKGRGILRDVPTSMFGFRAAGPHIRQVTKPGKLDCKEAQIRMSVARVTELSATSETSFEDAINVAVTRATKTLRGVEGAWVKDQNVMIEDGNITGYKVNVEITFMLEE